MAEFRRATALRKAFIAASLALAIAGCGQAPLKPSPTHVGMNQPARPEGTIPAPVRVAPVLPPPTPTLRPETYSVVVTNVQVKDLLFALARDAKLNVDIHPGITGSVTLNAIDQTLPQLLSRISKQVDIRYEMDGSNLLVERDTPVLRPYKIDYPALERRVDTTVIASSDIGATASGGGSTGTAPGASGGGTRIRITQTNTFWANLEKNVDDLMREEDRILTQRIVTMSAGGSVSTNVSAQGSGAAGGTIGSPVAGSGAAGSGNQQVQGQSTASAAAQQAVSAVQNVKYVIANPEAGVLLVRATSRVHEKVQQYLDQILPRVKRQVLIEATIAEVQLNNQYQRGIDWSLIRSGAAGFDISQSSQGPSTIAGINSSLLVMNYVAKGISATLRLLESFGNVRVLSSPKISVLNNQTAILKVVDNRVYFTVTGSVVQAANVGTTSNFTTTPQVVSVGFVMNVTPQISETGSILLNIRPSVSRILGFVNDPNPSLAQAGVVNRVPEVQTREMESMIRVDDGQIAVMGGLIQDSLADNEDSIPGLNRLPAIGNVFSNRNQSNTKTELVIFLRPVIVRDASIDGDYREYRTLLPNQDFMSQPNPGKPIIEGSTAQ